MPWINNKHILDQPEKYFSLGVEDIASEQGVVRFPLRLSPYQEKVITCTQFSKCEHITYIPSHKVAIEVTLAENISNECCSHVNTPIKSDSTSPKIR